MSQRIFDIVRFKAQMVGSAAVLREHGADRGILAERRDQFNLGSVPISFAKKSN
jgi:hypothetical protein